MYYVPLYLSVPVCCDAAATKAVSKYSEVCHVSRPLPWRGRWWRGCDGNDVLRLRTTEDLARAQLQRSRRSTEVRASSACWFNSFCPEFQNGDSD